VHTARTGALSVRVFTGFEPFVFRRDGDLVGCDVDILQGFCDLHSLSLTLSPVPQFEDIWLSPLLADVDLAAAGIARFDVREHPGIAWSAAYFEVERSILVRIGGGTPLKSMADFDGRTIAFVAGSSADLDTRARAPAGARLRPIANQSEGMMLLRSGTIDGLAMGTPSNSFNAHGEADFELIDVHKFSQDEGLRFPLAQGNAGLLTHLNAYIERGRTSGEFDSCFERWTRDVA
jgi:ABC-type amino acid transport substrate-binding protein